jgi:hypothetical protein
MQTVFRPGKPLEKSRNFSMRAMASSRSTMRLSFRAKDSILQEEGICLAEQRPLLIDLAFSISVELAGATLFLEPPLESVKPALVIPFSLQRRTGNLMPEESRPLLDSSNLEWEDYHAVLLANAALAAAQTLKAQCLYLLG